MLVPAHRHQGIFSRCGAIVAQRITTYRGNRLRLPVDRCHFVQHDIRNQVLLRASHRTKYVRDAARYQNLLLLPNERDFGLRMKPSGRYRRGAPCCAPADDAVPTPVLNRLSLCRSIVFI